MADNINSNDEPQKATQAFGLRFGKNKNLVLFFAGDKPIQVRYGDDQSLWSRALNPGSVTKGTFKTDDMIGTLPGHYHFAIFPTREAGLDAQRKLLQTKSYQDRTIREAMDMYDAGRGPAHERYVLKVTTAAGVKDNTKLSALSTAQFESLFQAIVQQESSGASSHAAIVYDFPDTLPNHSYSGLIDEAGTLDSNATVTFLKANVPVNIIPLADYPQSSAPRAHPLVKSKAG